MRSRRLLLNTGVNIGAQGVATLIALVSLPLLLQAFGQNVYGVFLLASSTVGLVALLDFGVGITTVRLVAAHLEREEPDELARTVSSATVIYGAIGALASLALFAVGAFADVIFRVGPAEAELLRLMLWIYAVAQLIIWPASVARQVLAGHERYPTIVTVSVLVTTGNALAIVAVLYTGQGPLVLTALQVGVTVLGSVTLTVLALRALPRHLHWGRVNRQTLMHIIALGLPVFTVQIAAFLMRQQTDRIVLGVFLGAAAVAIYEAAAKLGSLIAQLNDLTTSAMLPYMTRREVSRGGEGMGVVFLTGTRYTGLLLMPVIAGLVAIAPNLITAWVGAQLGPDVAATIVSARLLVLSQAGLVLYSVADPILIGKGRFQRWTPYAVALAGLNFVLSVILVQRFGVIGAAAGTFVACAVELPLYMRVVSQEIGVSIASWGKTTFAPSVAAGGLVFAAVEVARQLIHPTSLWSAGAIVAGALLLTWAVVFFGLFSSEERITLRALFSIEGK